MMARLFLLFLILPAIDLAVLVAVGNRLGFVPTLGLVVLTAAVGSFLARREGVAAWTRLQERLRSGALPGPEIIDGVLVLAAGILLLTPGFVTDGLGLLGLFPPTRRLVARRLTARFQRGVSEGSVRIVHAVPFPSRPTPSSVIEDAEVVDDGTGAS